MRFIRNLSIKTKLIWIQLTTTLIVLSVCVTGILFFNLGVMRDAVVNNLLSMARVIGTNSSVTLQFDDPDAAADVLMALSSERSIAGAFLMTADNQLFAEYGDSDLDYSNVTKDLAAYTTQKPGEYTLIEHSSIRVIKDIWSEDESLVGRLFLVSDLSALNTVKSHSATIAVFMSLMGLLLTVLVASILQKRISKPALDLVRIAKNVAESKDYSIRAQVGGKDEFVHLFRGFNEMMDQISDGEKALQAAQAGLEEKVSARTTELQKSMEEAKELATRAEAATKAKSEFLATDDLSSSNAHQWHTGLRKASERGETDTASERLYSHNQPLCRCTFVSHQ